MNHRSQQGHRLDHTVAIPLHRSSGSDIEEGVVISITILSNPAKET